MAEKPVASTSVGLKGKSPAEQAKIPETDFYIIAWGLVALSACTSLDDEAATRRANREHPTGIESRWQLADEDFADGTKQGAPCPDFPGHRHLLFNC